MKTENSKGKSSEKKNIRQWITYWMPFILPALFFIDFKSVTLYEDPWGDCPEWFTEYIWFRYDPGLQFIGNWVWILLLGILWAIALKGSQEYSLKLMLLAVIVDFVAAFFAFAIGVRFF